MSTYLSSPAAPPPRLLSPNVPFYAFGSKAIGPKRLMQVTRVSLTGNVATLTVAMREGLQLPVTGDLITVTGTASTSGLFNVTNVALASVSIDSLTGIGTLTFALVHADVGAVADAGQAYSPVPEVSESLGVAKSIQAAVDGYGISWAYTCPSAPSTIAIQLEGAINDVDAEYTLIGTSQTATSGYTEIFATLPELVRFVRLNVTATTGGTNPTIIGKIMNSSRAQ